MISPPGSTSSTTTLRPRYATERTPERRTRGGRVAKIAAAMGKPFLPWQRAAVDVALELNDDGSWTYPIVVVSVQRQAGKTTMFGPVAHERAATTRDGKCWWTAQTRQDARDSWLDMLELIGRSPLGSAATVRKSNGSEAVTYPSGGSFRPFAPTEDALHGKANELVAVDEAWAFDAAEGAALDQAILPTFTTTGGQLWIISTAGTAASAWLLEYIQRGRAAVRAGRRDTICLIEYGVTEDTAAEVQRAMTAYKEDPEAPGVAAAYDDALRLVLDAHPAYGHTLKLSALKQAAEKMTPGAFLRAYGNHWTAAVDQVIPAHAWEAARIPAARFDPPEPGSLALTFDVSVDGADSAICAAWRPASGGPVRVDVIDARPGSSWLEARVLELVERWRVPVVGCDGAGPVLDVADRLERRGLDVTRLGTRDYVTACSAFLADVTAGQLEHAGRSALDAAVTAAARRTVGDGWAFSRRMSAATISPLVAATVARWLHDHRPAPPEAPAVVIRRASSDPARAARARRAARRAARVG